MRRTRWMWQLLLVGTLLACTVTEGGAASERTNPLEGKLLRTSLGSVYVYHDGLKYEVESADVGDQLTGAIPTASVAQWQAFFTIGPAVTPVVPAIPQPFPGYS